MLNRVFSGDADGAGTALDLGDGTVWDKLNFQLRVPGTVTACTMLLQGSPDDDEGDGGDDPGDYVNVIEIDNALSAEGTIRVIAGYRYLWATLSNYAGSGTITLDVEAGVSNQQN